MRKSVAAVRKEGWVFRESGYIDGIVNPRYGAIYPHAVVTFRCSVPRAGELMPKEFCALRVQGTRGKPLGSVQARHWKFPGAWGAISGPR